MKKLFLVGMMTMLTGSAWAEWVKYDKIEKDTFYYDPATIRKEGNLRRVWQLMNLSQRDKNGVMSFRMRMEYDCMQERYRWLDVSKHSGPLGSGTILETFVESSNWTSIPFDTNTQIVLNLVCAK